MKVALDKAKKKNEVYKEKNKNLKLKFNKKLQDLNSTLEEEKKKGRGGDEMNIMKAELEDKEKEIERLTRSEQALTARLKSIEEDLERLKASERAANLKLLEFEQEQRRRGTKAGVDLESLLEEKEKMVGELKVRVTEMQSEMKKKDTKITELEANQAVPLNMQNLPPQLSRRFSAASSTGSPGSPQDTQRMKETISSMGKELKVREQKITDLEAQVEGEKKLQDEIAALKRENQAMLARVEELQAQCNDLETKLAAATQQHQTLTN